jgi:hypothetical protein
MYSQDKAARRFSFLLSPGGIIIDLQDFAGHADPRTTRSYIRTRDRLSQSPAYVLKC